MEKTATGINFLPEVAEKEIQKGVYKRKINVVAVGALLAVGLIIFGLISYQLFLSAQAGQLKKDTTKQEARFTEKRSDGSTLAEIEIKNEALIDKLNKAEKFLKEQLPGSVAIGETQTAANTDADAANAPEISLKKLNLTSDGTYLVTGFATNSQVFNTWVTNLTNTNGLEYFAKINMVNFTGAPARGYDFDFNLKFVKRGVYPTEEAAIDEIP